MRSSLNSFCNESDNVTLSVARDCSCKWPTWLLACINSSRASLSSLSVLTNFLCSFSFSAVNFCTCPCNWEILASNSFCFNAYFSWSTDDGEATATAATAAAAGGVAGTLSCDASRLGAVRCGEATGWRSAAAADFFSFKAARRARNSSNLFCGLPGVGVAEEEEDAVDDLGVVAEGFGVEALPPPPAPANSRRRRKASNFVNCLFRICAFRTKRPELAGQLKYDFPLTEPSFFP
mmetsp:Transcript_14159/g.39165  ORF Transcript_14159/g.39165 Transcript_14159/m.39165 type:complete len:235 (-) Transcript_14159:171-875(-)